MQTPTDKPRHRTPSNAPIPASSDRARAQIDISWSKTAAQTLRSHAHQGAEEQPLRDQTPSKIAQGAKRAYNLAVRSAIAGALQSARPLYPALVAHLETGDWPAQWQLNLQFVDDAEMQSLNLDTRGKDKPTDVLSFPVWEGETFPFPPGQSEVALGDMVISVDTAIRQAREQNHDLRAELAFLGIHGALHLLGYDHHNGSARRQMFALQDRIFERVRGEKKF